MNNDSNNLSKLYTEQVKLDEAGGLIDKARSKIPAPFGIGQAGQQKAARNVKINSRQKELKKAFDYRVPGEGFLGKVTGQEIQGFFNNLFSPMVKNNDQLKGFLPNRGVNPALDDIDINKKYSRREARKILDNAVQQGYDFMSTGIVKGASSETTPSTETTPEVTPETTPETTPEVDEVDPPTDRETLDPADFKDPYAFAPGSTIGTPDDTTTPTVPTPTEDETTPEEEPFELESEPIEQPDPEQLELPGTGVGEQPSTNIVDNFDDLQPGDGKIWSDNDTGVRWTKDKNSDIYYAKPDTDDWTKHSSSDKTIDDMRSPMNRAMNRQMDTSPDNERFELESEPIQQPDPEQLELPGTGVGEQPKGSWREEDQKKIDAAMNELKKYFDVGPDQMSRAESLSKLAKQIKADPNMAPFFEKYKRGKNRPLLEHKTYFSDLIKMLD